MKQWFDEAVEKATETPFPWGVVFAIIGAVVLLGVGGFLLLPVLRAVRENHSRTKRYRKSKRNEQSMSGASRGIRSSGPSRRRSRRRR